MILSNESLFSNNQQVLATGLSTNVVDTGVKGTPTWGAAAFAGDIGKGTPVPIEVLVTETFTGATSVKFALETGDAATLGTELNSVTVAVAGLTKGTRINIDHVPSGAKRFLGLRYIVTGTGTAGKVTAGVSHGAGNNQYGV